MGSPDPLARTISRLGVKVAWASPVAVTRINHICPIIPLGSHREASSEIPKLLVITVSWIPAVLVFKPTVG